MPRLAQVPAELEFFVLRADGLTEGPYVGAQLQELLRQGIIDPQTRLRPVGLDSWIPAFRVLEGAPELRLVPAPVSAWEERALGPLPRRDETPAPVAEAAPTASIVREPAAREASPAFHPHAPAAALLAGFVGLIAWVLPLAGYIITVYGGWQAILVVRAGRRDGMALVGGALCVVGFGLSVANTVAGLVIALSRP